MARNFLGEAQRESDDKEAAKRWYQVRVEAVLQNVTAHDVLRRNGINLKQSSSDREEQFACPFHGRDRKPSARVYPDTVRGPSHVWCFVCQERWDVIKLWKKFGDSEARFTRVLGEIERAFGILPPERPPAAHEMEEEDPELIEVDTLFHLCECRLLEAREAYEMQGYLTAGSILDKLHYEVEEGITKPSKAKPVLQRLLDRIGIRVRAWQKIQDAEGF